MLLHHLCKWKLFSLGSSFQGDSPCMALQTGLGCVTMRTAPSCQTQAAPAHSAHLASLLPVEGWGAQSFPRGILVVLASSVDQPWHGEGRAVGEVRWAGVQTRSILLSLRLGARCLTSWILGSLSPKVHNGTGI